MSSEFTTLAEVLTEVQGWDPDESSRAANELIGTMWKRGYRFVEVEPRVETQVWEPDPERPGYLKFVRSKTVREVLDEIVDITGPYPAGCSEGLGVYPGVYDADFKWPREGRLVVFSVNGSSEGDWVHVQMQHNGQATGLLLSKTFDGRDASWAYARRLADLLEER